MLAGELAADPPPHTYFTTPQAQHAFVNKLNALGALIDAGSYDEAQAKLADDLMKYNAKWGTPPVGATLTDISTKLAALQAQQQR